MSATFGNKYVGLSQGPIDKESSSLINMISGVPILLVGDAINVDIFNLPLDQLLPEARDVLNGAFYGVVVGGDVDGVYGIGREPETSAEGNEFGTAAAFMFDTVRVCTQGRCLAKVVNQTTSVLEIGQPLTGLIDAPNDIFAALGVPSSGDIIGARLLQSVPAGISAAAPAIRIVAVDIQREGKFP